MTSEADIQRQMTQWADKTLAIGNSQAELVFMVANMMLLGYEPDGDVYQTNDNYYCQPMINKRLEVEDGR